MLFSPQESSSRVVTMPPVAGDRRWSTVTGSSSVKHRPPVHLSPKGKRFSPQSRSANPTRVDQCHALDSPHRGDRTGPPRVDRLCHRSINDSRIQYTRRRDVGGFLKCQHLAGATAVAFPRFNDRRRPNNCSTRSSRCRRRRGVRPARSNRGVLGWRHGLLLTPRRHRRCCLVSLARCRTESGPANDACWAVCGRPLYRRGHRAHRDRR